MITFFIVVPTFNSERFVQQTLDSVLKQRLTECRVHLHVQDGASTDSTLDIVRCFASEVEAYADPDLVHLTYASELDRGMYDAVNHGVQNWSERRWRPDIFFWLNSDDTLLENALLETARVFSESCFDWLVGRAVDIDETGAVVLSKPHEHITRGDLLTGNFNYKSAQWLRAESTAIRFDLFRSVGMFASDLRLAGDFDLFLKLARSTKPTFADVPLRAFRRHEGQLSQAAAQYQHERSLSLFRNRNEEFDNKTQPPTRTKSREIIFYPDYRQGNSYQRLLYDDCSANGIARLDEFIKLASISNGSLLHVHWLNQIVSGTRAEAIARSEQLLAALRGGKSRGSKVLFTVHNILSHEGANAAVEEVLTKQLFEVADVVHVHHPVVSIQIEDAYKTFPWGKVVVGEHGPYPFSSNLRREEVARLFDMPEDVPYLVVPGQIRQYKDLEFLLMVVEYIANTAALRKFHILFAGTVHPEVQASASVKSIICTPNVHIACRRLDDDEFSTCLANAAYAFLSYRAISTSGSLFHALSMGTPVIAPSLGTIPSYAFDGINAFMYQAGDTHSCFRSLARAVAAYHSGGYGEIRTNAKRSVEHLSWRLTLENLLAAVERR